MEKLLKVKAAFEKTQQALASLQNVVDKTVDAERMVIDSCIQRFEFSLELMLRLLQRILETKLEYCTTTKSILQAAYKAQLINDEQTWVDMWHDRNLTVHTYNQAFADQLHHQIQTRYFKILNETLSRLEVEIAE
jgi:nucleotidyltransferase substrate binding protein (TIGR01987 family)